MFIHFRFRWSSQNQILFDQNHEIYFIPASPLLQTHSWNIYNLYIQPIFCLWFSLFQSLLFSCQIHIYSYRLQIHLCQIFCSLTPDSLTFVLHLYSLKSNRDSSRSVLDPIQILSVIIHNGSYKIHINTYMDERVPSIGLRSIYVVTCSDCKSYRSFMHFLLGIGILRPKQNTFIFIFSVCNTDCVFSCQKFHQSLLRRFFLSEIGWYG